MKRSKEQLESELGIKLPDAPISEGSEPPIDDPASGIKFDLIGFIIGKYQVFKKTRSGQLIGLYLFLTGLGIPLPTPYGILKFSIGNVSDYSQLAYEQFEHGFRKPQDMIVIEKSSIQTYSPDTEYLSIADLPIGATGIALSGQSIG